MVAGWPVRVYGDVQTAQGEDGEVGMIIDTHVWLSKPEHWGDQDIMDDAMYKAGWAARGARYQDRLTKGINAEQMVEIMDEAGVDMAVCHSVKVPRLNTHVPTEWGDL